MTAAAVDQARLIAAARSLVALSENTELTVAQYREACANAIEEVRAALAAPAPHQRRRVALEVLVADADDIHCAEACPHLETTKAWCRLFSTRLGWQKQRPEYLRDAACKLAERDAAQGAPGFQVRHGGS